MTKSAALEVLLLFGGQNDMILVKEDSKLEYVADSSSHNIKLASEQNILKKAIEPE